MFQALDVYLEKRKTRQYAGRLFKQGNWFVFEYDESYRICSNPVPLGPDLPLDRKTHTSLKLFPSFEDRLPSKGNPAYREYCRTAGIPVSETDPFTLLLKLARKGPSSFIFLPAPKEEGFAGGDMRRFRENMQLSVREFALLFDISPATVYRIENAKTGGRKTLKHIADFAANPQKALDKIRRAGDRINETKRRFAENFIRSLLQTHTGSWKVTDHYVKGGRAPFGPWNVTGKDVEECRPQQAVELLRKLILSECGAYGIPQSGAHISHNLPAPDGGQDGRVFWPDGIGPLRGTNFFPRSYNSFQVKAGKVSPSQCQKEILDKKGELKPAVRDVIKNRGAYILFSTKGVAGTGIQEREEALEGGIAEHGIEVRFYDANIIADWINRFPPVALWFLKKVCGRPLGLWLSWEEWSREETDYSSQFMFHKNLTDKKNAVREFLSQPKRIVHLRGAGGVGKTRLALEALQPVSLATDYEAQKTVRPYSSKTKTSRTGKNLRKPEKDLNDFSTDFESRDFPKNPPEGLDEPQAGKGLENSVKGLPGSPAEKEPEKPPEDMSPFVLYGAAEELRPSHLRELKNYRAILVIDDCSREKAESFHKIAVQEDSRLSLLTVGNDLSLPEERPGGYSVNSDSPAFSSLQSPENSNTTDLPSSIQSNRQKEVTDFPFPTQHIGGSALSAPPLSSRQTESSVGGVSLDGKKLTVTLEPDGEIVKKILAGDRNIENKWFRPEILTLTQGFPLMAKLLKEAGPRILEKDDLATLRKKMLWGLEERDEDAEKVIKACALFDTICVADFPEGIISSGIQRGEAEVKYVANKIAKMDYDTFYKKMRFFKKRRIIQKHGRFIQVRPKPLAVWLAVELIEETPPESIIEWIAHMKISEKPYKYSPGEKEMESKLLAGRSDEWKKEFKKYQAHRLVLQGLRESFCRQIAWSVLSSSAQKLAKKLCEKGGLFGTEEALDTEWGSRCFRYLSEASPETALQTLGEVFGCQKPEELIRVREGRRNLIRTLQQLAVWEALYLKAARLLLKFAEAENENWSNNATGVFIDHFQLYLSGTEAGPDKKFRIIEEIQTSNSVEQKAIALQALGKALSTGSFVRSSDIMQTTAGKIFEDWMPKIYDERQDYFRKALNLLVQFATKDENMEIQNRACDFIAGNLSSLLKQGLYNEAGEAIKTVWLESSQPEEPRGTEISQPGPLLKNNKVRPAAVSKTGGITINKRESHRISAVNELSHFLRYNSEKITEDKKKYVEKWLDLLQSEQSLADRIRSYITKCSRDDLRGQRREKENERYEQGFQELIKDFVSLIENGERKNDPFGEDTHSALKLLFHGEQRNTFRFAKALVRSLKNPFEFAVSLLDLAKRWKRNERFSFTFPAGVLMKLRCINAEKAKKLLDKIAGDGALREFLIPSYRYMDLRDGDIIRLFNVMDKMTWQPQVLNELRDLTTGQRCKFVSTDVIGKLMKSLIQKKEAGFSWAALQIYIYYENKKKPDEKKIKLLPILYDLLTREDLLSAKKTSSTKCEDSCNYETAADTILNSNSSGKRMKQEGSDETDKKPEYGRFFSEHFFSQIMKSGSSIDDLSIDTHTIKTCFTKILEKYPDPVLSGIKKILIAGDGSKGCAERRPKFKGNVKQRSKIFQQEGYDKMKIKRLFRNENFFGDPFFPLSVLKAEQLKKWCEAAPDHIPAFLAECLPLLSVDQKSWTSFARFLFDEYGDRESVTRAVSKNLHTFSGTGGMSRYFKRLISVLKQIGNHRRENVRNFVDREIFFLKREITREEATETEREEFGVY